MPSLLLVTLFTIACVLFPQSAIAQSQTRDAPRQTRYQIAFKAPNASPVDNAQQGYDYPAVNQGGDNNWSSEANGTAAAYASPNSNLNPDTNAYDYSAPAASQATGRASQSYDRVYNTYAMSQADVISARRAVLNGSFFRYHGTQSSQISRNR